MSVQAPLPEELPQPSIAVFSSFHRFLPEIAAARLVFADHGMYVSTPANAEPIDPYAQYVRFPGDDPTLPDHEIQERVLQTARHSTAIYVLCPGGYTGKTVSYEVGRMIWHAVNPVPMYFSHMPGLRAIQVHAEGRIVSPHKLAHIILEDALTPTPDPYAHFKNAVPGQL